MLIKKIIKLGLLIGFLTVTSIVHTQEKTAQELVGACARCHGTDGNSISGQYPNLAGQNEEYLIK